MTKNAKGTTPVAANGRPFIRLEKWLDPRQSDDGRKTQANYTSPGADTLCIIGQGAPIERPETFSLIISRDWEKMASFLVVWMTMWKSTRWETCRDQFGGVCCSEGVLFVTVALLLSFFFFFFFVLVMRSALNLGFFFPLSFSHFPVDSCTYKEREDKMKEEINADGRRNEKTTAGANIPAATNPIFLVMSNRISKVVKFYNQFFFPTSSFII